MELAGIERRIRQSSCIADVFEATMELVSLSDAETCSLALRLLVVHGFWRCLRPSEALKHSGDLVINFPNSVAAHLTRAVILLRRGRQRDGSFALGHAIEISEV